MSADGRRLRLGAASLLASAALALAACGGGETSTAAESTTPAGPDADVMAEFSACMEENGASLPEGGAIPGGPPPSGAEPGEEGTAQPAAPPQLDEEMQAALEACSELMPEPPAGAPTAPPAS